MWPDAEFAATPADAVGRNVRKYFLHFQWTPAHLTSAELMARRVEGDVAMDAALLAILSSGGLEKATATSQEAAALWRDMSTVPAWVDWPTIARGQRFLQHALPLASTSLFFVSLLGGYSSGAIVKVLVATGYLSHPRRAFRRLLETFSFVCGVGLDVTPGSDGWRRCAQVRVIHAAVRRRLPKVAGHRGVAVNQEDLCVTLLAFSYLVVYGVERLGCRVDSDDREAYIHLWRYVGYLLGVDDRYNPCLSFSTARTHLESIVVHIVQPDDHSRQLVDCLLRIYPGSHAPEIFRYLVQDDLADDLHVPKRRLPSLRFAIFAVLTRCYAIALRLPLVARVLSACHVGIMRLVVRHIAVADPAKLGSACPLASSKREAE